MASETKSRRVAILGAGAMGRQVLHHLLAHYGDTRELLGFVDDTRTVGEPIAAGLATLGSFEAFSTSAATAPSEVELVFAIGYADMTGRRAALERVLDAGYRLASVVHPQAMIEPGVEIGAGSIVLAGAILDQGVSIGEACYVDIGVRLGADTKIGRGNWLSSGTSTGSRVRIGDDCFFGMDCTITTDVQIGSENFVNAKSLVARDLGDRTKFVELHKARSLPIADPDPAAD